MYYEEKVVEGILCWRNDKEGSWIPFAPHAMTARIQRLEKELKYFKERFTFVVTPE
jgi:hypothetical protein